MTAAGLPTPRLILIEESLDSDPTPGCGVREYRRFSAALSDGQPITVVEYEVPRIAVYSTAHAVAAAIKTQRFYAHVAVSGDEMAIIFPGCVVDLQRGAYAGVALAHQLGQQLAIPLIEMQFEAMFDNDHPDLEGG